MTTDSESLHNGEKLDVVSNQIDRYSDSDLKCSFKEVLNKLSG